MKKTPFYFLLALTTCTPALAQTGVLYNTSGGETSNIGQSYYLRPSEPLGPRDDSPPALTWNGLYVGANVGFAGDEFSYPVSATDATGAVLGSGSAHLNSSGVIGGGQIGYNYQFNGPFVIGIEGDIQGASVTGEVGVNGSTGGTAFSAKAGSQLNYLGTVRGRLGYVILNNRGLIYATGGLAYGGLHSYANGSIGGAALGVSKDTTAMGWTVGGGFEYALTDHLTLRTEYLFADLGNETLYNGPLLGVNNVHLAVGATANIFRAGLNYKFDFPEAVVAKY